ncbi:MAG: flippase-like domain-containing protein [Acidimicrobiales bacterium]|jgi:uncharacterized membrane protein YbhN (UPF0104 family)|nr:flippase-like domain-containing protein [Acidimicrobiales bacterium]
MTSGAADDPSGEGPPPDRPDEPVDEPVDCPVDELVDDPADLRAVVENELHRKSPGRRVLEATVSLAIVGVLFAFVVPAVTDAHYSEIWREIQKLDWLQVAGLASLWMFSMVLYTGVLTTTLPGLSHPQALTVNFAGSAVSNVVPFGGAVGVGATYGVEMSWGFRVSAITLSILVSGIWNVLTKLALPVVALVLLVVTGRSTAELLAPTLLGLAALTVAVVVLSLVLRSESLAAAVGAVAQRVVTPLARWVRRSSAPDMVGAVCSFRRRSIGLLRTRWWRISLWMLGYNLGQFLLLLACVRAIGIGTEELGWVEVFAAFAFARLLETIPLTPSGVGFVEAGAVAALIGFGGGDAAAAAAVFLFRGFTYLAEIPLGLAAWGVWATKRSWRAPQPAEVPARPSVPS